ncbi:MAG TPA: hypothetical protein VGO04_24380 [Ensifer sp.]|uniref:hypothetical protein n=1 Tax=Ensifer sp. TaxID=1872086 RepID=UPI002E0F86D6|nr:hypothetical protein [Ensifer sp.]
MAMKTRSTGKVFAAILVGTAWFMVATVATAQDRPLASIKGADPEVRIDVTSLRRTEAETLTLRLQVTNNGSSSYSMVADNIRLIDLAGRRSYTPGVTGPSCSTLAGKTSSCYAIFGAPPATTKTINIQFYEKVDLISGVPIDER